MTQRDEPETGADDLASVLRDGAVRSVFQPVIELDTDQVAGFEALTRGPAGALAQPVSLFDAARRSGRLPELDWLCRETAVATAGRRGYVLRCHC